MRVPLLAFAVMVAAAVLFVGGEPAAYAYNDAGWSGGWVPGCICHYAVGASTNGPHGGYTSGTKMCSNCHTLHDAPTDNRLLPGETISETCDTCHDGTGGSGPYGTIVARGLSVGGGHGVETTSVVPGGNAASGGSATMTFSGTGGTLTCGDCHSPHASNCVTPFLGERQRVPAAGLQNVAVSNRLLKQRPAGVLTPTAEYGSDWCLSCHQGRASNMTTGVMNHPVESKLTTTSPYVYRALGIIGTGPYPTGETTVGPAGINTKTDSYNRAYLMPFPRTGAQAGHLPICQQCHEDTRYVGNLTADGTQAMPSTSTVTIVPFGGDGLNPADNPRFQNFPHETTGYRLLVEAGTTASTDDLCLNCHPVAALP